jgi:hypothetical protein
MHKHIPHRSILLWMPSRMVFDGNDVTSKKMGTVFKRVPKREIFYLLFFVPSKPIGEAT